MFRHFSQILKMLQGVLRAVHRAARGWSILHLTTEDFQPLETWPTWKLRFPASALFGSDDEPWRGPSQYAAFEYITFFYSVGGVL